MLSLFTSSKMKHLFLYQMILRLKKFLFQVNILKYWLDLLLLWLCFCFAYSDLLALHYWIMKYEIVALLKFFEVNLQITPTWGPFSPHVPVAFSTPASWTSFLFLKQSGDNAITHQESCYFTKICVPHESIYCYCLRFLDEWIYGIEKPVLYQLKWVQAGSLHCI